MTEIETGVRDTMAPATYRRLMIAFAILAGLALGVGAALERPYIAVGVYVVAMTIAVAIPYGTSLTLFDERDDTVHREASGITLALFGWLSALVFPSLVALSTTDVFAWGPVSGTIAWMTAAVYGVYVLAIGYVRSS